MKNPTKSFAQTYPYLTYWIEDWGEMETTNGDWNRSRIRLLDEGGTCYEDYDSKTHDKALQKAEKYLREEESKRFDKESRKALEEEYRELGLWNA